MTQGTIAIVLAAGKGERLGGPKALLAWRSAGVSPASPDGEPERPLAIAHAAARLGAESGRVLIVARRPVIKVLLGYLAPGVELVASDAPDELGPAGSLAVAAGRLGSAEVVVVAPVDTLPARPQTVAALLSRLRSGDPPPLAVRPRHKGRGGHPVVLRAPALARYREADPPPLRDHLRALGDRCVDEDVQDAAVLLDLDTPADVVRATGAPPRFLA